MRTKDDAKALIKAWGTKAGLDEDGINKLLGNDEVLNEATNQLRMHDEMASGIDRAKNDAKAELERLTKWYNEVAQPTVSNAQRVQAAYERYRQQFGDLDDGSTGNTGNVVPRDANGRFASRDDVNNIATSAVNVSKDLSYIVSDYNYRFGSKFGPMTREMLDDFEKFAVSRGRPPMDAYREWTADKDRQIREEADQKQKDDFAAQIKAAREEGIREGQTRRQWDGETTRRNTDIFGRDLDALKLQKESPDDAEKKGDEAFHQAWQDWERQHANDLR